MNTFIVVIPTEYSNARKLCETVENMKFDSLIKLRNFLNENIELIEDKQPQFFSLSDFMDEVNDEYFNHESCFISYAQIGVK